MKRFLASAVFQSASAVTSQREPPLDTEGRNLAKLRMNSHLAKLQVPCKEVEGTSQKSNTQ